MKTALLLALAAARAGTTPPAAPAPPEVPQNPLSFWEGKLVLSLENQTRFEYRDNNFDFNDATDALTDDGWLLNRARIGLAWKPLHGLTFFVQGQDSREWNSDRPNVPGALGAEGDDPFDLHQAYIEYSDPKTSPWGIKAGRQKLSYGDQRLIGPLEWSNPTRCFDAVKLTYHLGDGSWVDAFAASPVIVDRDDVNEADFDNMLYGIYGHIAAERLDWEPYVLYRDDNDLDQEFVTVGMHLKSKAGANGPWDYEGECAYQNGDIGARDLSAFAGFVRGGYTWTEAAWKPRAGLEYSYASGDDDATDGDVATFQNLYPTNHPNYGWMDAWSWQNLHNIRLSLSAKPMKKLTATADLHFFWLADTADAWRRANASTMVRPISPGADSYAGSEFDLLLNYTISPNASVLLGYSHFFAGSYLNDTGAGDDADFFYAITQFKF